MRPDEPSDMSVLKRSYAAIAPPNVAPDPGESAGFLTELCAIARRHTH
jgi:hypothetical protein